MAIPLSQIYFSTIFRTITDESTGAVKSIGLLGKSMDDFRNTINSIKVNGLKNTLFNKSTIDVSAVNAYNQAITDGVSAQDALAQASKTTNRETINLMKSANGAKVSSEALAAAQRTTTIATKAASLAMKAFSVAANMVVITLITSAVASFINKIQEAREEISNTAQKAGESLDTAKSDLQELNSLIKEYNDLHTSGQWDNTDIKTKKQLQKDINSLLDDEADKLDIVEGKYENITAELYKQRLEKLGKTEKAASDGFTYKCSEDFKWSNVDVIPVKDTIIHNGESVTCGFSLKNLKISKLSKHSYLSCKMIEKVKHLKLVATVPQSLNPVENAIFVVQNSFGDEISREKIIYNNNEETYEKTIDYPRRGRKYIIKWEYDN